MNIDQMRRNSGDAWLWTERTMHNARSVVIGDAHALSRWIAKESEKAESVLTQGGVQALTWVDTRYVGRVPGHHYDTVITLGRFERVSPAMLLEAIRHNPKHFPIPGDKNFDPGAVVTLTFMGTRNEVLVRKIDTSNPNRVSMLLQTRSDHFFQGTAEHIILRQANGQLAYEIIGNGPPSEPYDRNRINTWFGRYMWPRLVRERVLPLAEKVQKDDM